MALWSYSLSTPLASHNGLATAVTCYQISAVSSEQYDVSRPRAHSCLRPSRGRPQASSTELLPAQLNTAVPRTRNLIPDRPSAVASAHRRSPTCPSPSPGTSPPSRTPRAGSRITYGSRRAPPRARRATPSPPSPAGSCTACRAAWRACSTTRRPRCPCTRTSPSPTPRLGGYGRCGGGRGYWRSSEAWCCSPSCGSTARSRWRRVAAGRPCGA